MARRCNRKTSDSEKADREANSNAFRQAEGLSVNEPSTIPSHNRRCCSLQPSERQNTDSIDSPYRSTFCDLEADFRREEEGVLCAVIDLETSGVRRFEDDDFRSALFVGSLRDGECLMIGDCNEFRCGGGALFSLSLPASEDDANEGIFSDGMANETLLEDSMVDLLEMNAG